MEQVKRLNIQTALSYVKGRSGGGLTRIPNSFHPEDLRLYMRAIGNELLQGRFTLDGDNSYVYENIRKWVDGNPEFDALDPETNTYGKGDIGRGLYIAGPTGTGKTILLEIMSRYAKGLYLKLSVNGSEVPLGWETYRSDEICMEVVRTGDIDRFVKVPVLCINDIGSEQKETLYMGNRIEVIRTVLERRGDNYLSCLTLLTSNFRIGELDYGRRVESRLHEMCNYYELVGKDRRVGRG